MSGSPWKRVAWQKNMATLAKIPLVEQAENLDRQLKETGEFAGPMHGVPVSLKDQFHVKYAETTIGYVSWVGTFEGAQGTGREFHDQSQLVEELHSLGAVLYCKTVNNLIGRTMNPVNQLLSCGGSSGGEGALLALGASNVGACKNASDYCWRGIGGSVRIPAAFLWNVLYQAILRAILLSNRRKFFVDAVKRSGHTVIEWEPPSHEEALALHDIILDIDGGDDVWRQLNILHEPVIPQVSERFGNGPKDPVPTLELLDIVLKHKAYVARYLEYWASTVKHTGTGRAVDAVILPVAPHAAVIPGDAVLPVTKADKNVDVAHGDFKPLTPKDEVNWRAYTYDGAPVCVQLMGRKFEEERILGIAMRVEELFRKLTKWVVSALIVDN
ncbi:amidase domain protein [Metarhizium robertsii]|uniref:Amidase domain protein n=1 Tax=Metarhizium robertsii TaxID=568076 RepID=A0A014QUL0_9HYPO|nr:amidase domain protein [Metarhizium robertsii]